jgi:hypothetical protein
MSSAEILSSLGALVQGTAGGVILAIGLMIGACLALDVFKLRQSGPKSMTVKTIDEAMGTPAAYLPSSTPRGVTDRLKGFKPTV